MNVAGTSSMEVAMICLTARSTFFPGIFRSSGRLQERLVSSSGTRYTQQADIPPVVILGVEGNLGGDRYHAVGHLIPGFRGRGSLQGSQGPKVSSEVGSSDLSFSHRGMFARDVTMDPPFLHPSKAQKGHAYDSERLFKDLLGIPPIHRKR